MNRAEETLRLAREVIALESQIEEKKRLLTELVGGDGVDRKAAVATSSAPTGKKRTRRASRTGTRPGSLADRVRSVLTTKAGKLVTLAEILEALPNTKAKDVQRTAARLAGRRASGVKHAGRGKYRWQAVTSDDR